MDERAREVIALWERGDSERAVFKTHWQQCANYIQPDRADYILTHTPGQKRMQWVYDSHPLWCLDQFVSGLHSMLTSPTLQWFSLVTDDDRLNSIPRVKQWLDTASLTMYALFNSPRHNFASQTQEYYGDLGCIGTANMAVLESPRSGVLFSTRHMKECVLFENEEDRIDTNVRHWQWTAKQAYQQWGKQLPEQIGKAAVDKPDTKFKFYHGVRPRKLRDVTRARESKHMAFESVYVCENGDGIISEGGFPEFPYMASRFSRITGETYGRSRGMIALPDVKMLNELMKIVVKGAQKLLDPTLMVPDEGFVLPIKTTPGSMIFYRTGLRPTDRIQPLETGAQPQVGGDLMAGLRTSIERAFYVDLFRMPSDPTDPNSEGKGSTATYWMQRSRKEMLMLSPMLARLQTEYLGPLIDRVFAIMWRKSYAMKFGPGAYFPPPPPELSGASFHVEYLSPIALAQKGSQLDSVGQLIDMQQRLTALNPTAPVMVLDVEGIMRGTARDLNAPAWTLRTPADMQAEAQANAEAQAAMANHGAIANLAGAAKDAGAAAKNFAVAGAQPPAQEAA